MENANPETIQSWTHYFCEYSKWLPIVKEGPVADLPGSNFVVESRLLRSYTPFPEQGFGLETRFFEQCNRDGHQAHFVHNFRIRHLHVEKISTFWRYMGFHYGVWFGRTRGFGPLRRMCYAAVFPLTALVLYLRVFKIVMKSPPRVFNELSRSRHLPRPRGLDRSIWPAALVRRACVRGWCPRS